MWLPPDPATVTCPWFVRWAAAAERAGAEFWYVAPFAPAKRMSAKVWANCRWSAAQDPAVWDEVGFLYSEPKGTAAVLMCATGTAAAGRIKC